MHRKKKPRETETRKEPSNAPRGKKQVEYPEVASSSTVGINKRQTMLEPFSSERKPYLNQTGVHSRVSYCVSVLEPSKTMFGPDLMASGGR